MPHEFHEIVENIKEQNWLISTFPASENELYNPAAYLYHSKLHGLQYKIILDRNIFKFIISSIKAGTPNKKHRAAISLIYFCQASEINFEPNLAVYERLLPFRENTKEAINELISFYKIDNAHSDDLLEYAVSRSNELGLYEDNHWDFEELHKSLTEYEYLKEWKSIHLIILKIVECDLKIIKTSEKINIFFKWLVVEFRLSLPCIVFAIFLFSRNRLKKMNKYKAGDSAIEKRKQLYNMTWDLFLINSFFRDLTSEDNKYELLVATDDKVVKTILLTAIEVQNDASWQCLKNYLPEKEHYHIDLLEECLSMNVERIYNSDDWTPEYREELIEKYQDILIEGNKIV